MAADLDERVLSAGMTLEQCRELLGGDEEPYQGLKYEIPRSSNAEPCDPVALTFSQSLRVYDSGHTVRPTSLSFDSEHDCGVGLGAWKLTEAELMALQAVVVDGGLDRWCANQPGDRLHLAETMQGVIKHGWPAELSQDDLRACADHEVESWGFELATRGSWSGLSMWFEDGQLDSWAVWHDY